MIPQSVQDIIDLIGEAEGMLFIRQFGGKSVMFPADGTEPQNLLISPEKWRVLCETYAGCQVYIAKCYDYLIALRNIAIVADRANGATISALVDKYGLCNRRIIAICGEHDRLQQRSASHDIFIDDVQC